MDYMDAPPKRGTFFRLEVYTYKRVGISQDDVRKELEKLPFSYRKRSNG